MCFVLLPRQYNWLGNGIGTYSKIRNRIISIYGWIINFFIKWALFLNWRVIYCSNWLIYLNIFMNICYFRSKSRILWRQCIILNILNRLANYKCWRFQTIYWRILYWELLMKYGLRQISILICLFNDIYRRRIRNIIDSWFTLLKILYS